MFFQIISKWIDSTSQSLESLRGLRSKSFGTAACSVSLEVCVAFCLFSFNLCCLLFFLLFFLVSSAAVLYCFFGVIEYSRFLAFVDRCVFGLIAALNICFLEAFEDFTGAVWCILLLSLAWV